MTASGRGKAGSWQRSGGRRGKPLARLLGCSRGSQLVEFGLALPILLFLVMGVWDFGSAFALQEKLTNAAREATRIVVSTPLLNKPTCPTTMPCSIVAAANAAKIYLQNAGVTQASCITPDSPSTTSANNRAWTYTCKTVPGVSLMIDRGYTFTLPSGAVVPATRVILTWPTQWKLGGMLPAGSLPQTISTTIVMQNLT
jgi:Flp pilus assembly protein TadG